jgi:hypothetical protein
MRQPARRQPAACTANLHLVPAHDRDQRCVVEHVRSAHVAAQDRDRAMAGNPLNVGLGNALRRSGRRDEPGAQTVCSKVAFDAGGERQALHQARNVDRRDAVRGQLLAAVERTEHRAVDDRRGFEPCADVGRGAEAPVSDERDADLVALAFLVCFRASNRTADPRRRARRLRRGASRRRTSTAAARGHAGPSTPSRGL